MIVWNGGIIVKVLIQNGFIIDGTGKARYPGNIGIEDDRIFAVGDVFTGSFDKIIDAKNNIVSPGFIDTHSHSDLKIIIEPFVELKIRQGITTEVLGQDGVSMAPLPAQYIKAWRKNISGLNGDSDEIDWTYETTDGYLNLLERKGVGLNTAYLVPHGNIRMEAMGLDNRFPNEKEMERILDITRRELESGAFGLSTGLVYPPCTYSKTDEIIRICKIVADYDGVFMVHQRNEGADILASMEEIIQIGRETGVKVHFSHFKVCGYRNWGKIGQIIDRLEMAKSEGLKISFDQYPYIAGSTMLALILPPWAHDGGAEKLLERLQDKALRKRMSQDMKNGIEAWESIIHDSGPERVYVTGVATQTNNDVVGKNLIEIGDLRGKDPLEAAFDLLIEENNAVSMVIFSGNEPNVVRLMQMPEQNVCTDGLLGGSKPHPRVSGAFPRVLGKYVREDGILTLEEAIRKMTGKPAEVLGFKNRGLLKAGYCADIVIFNHENIIDRGTFDDPLLAPRGIEYVFINGKTVIEDGLVKKEINGRVLRKDQPCSLSR